MPIYSVPIDITANSQAEMAETATAIQTLLQFVKPADLKKLAAKIKAKPSLVAMALKYI